VPDTRGAPKELITREALEDVLIDRAAWTHARLSAGRQHRVELRETITQDLLLDICTALPALSVQAYTTRQEAGNGADWQWEWWFEDPSGSGYAFRPNGFSACDLASRATTLDTHVPGAGLTSGCGLTSTDLHPMP
jgi:hypothetical protein